MDDAARLLPDDLPAAGDGRARAQPGDLHTVEALPYGSAQRGTMPAIVSVRDVRKRYASGLEALGGVSLDIAEGEILALLGPNGAGKTTLISTICGITRMTDGQVMVGGHDVVTEFRRTRAMIGLVPQEIHLDIFAQVSASLENSEFNGRTPDAVFSESTTSGIRAGLDRVPDFTLAATWHQDWGLVKLAGVGRYFSSPTGGNTAFGWGINLSGQVNLWEGGSAMASVTGGDGIGRYIINGFGQDAFVDADGRIDTITSWGATVGLSHAFTPTLTGALTGGVYRVEDTFAATDTREIRTVHPSTFYRPVERLTLGGEVIYGQRETADGRTGDNVRLQAAVQVNF
jgi:hypothetical protein